jgi:DNA repair exonuclease SbcCD ATPase subunit
LQESVQSLTETLAARVERIKVLEAQAVAQGEALSERGKQIDVIRHERDELNAKVAALEVSLSNVNANVAKLEAAVAESSRARDAAVTEATHLRESFDSRMAGQQARIDELERDLAVSRAESAERSATMIRLEGERDDQINRLAAAQARALDLERRIEDNAEVIRQLQEELRAVLNRGTELEGDLTAAEDAINRLETELRTKSTKLEDLSRTHEEWRSTIEDARHSLAERDSLINRLETEAANSAVLLGNIQQSIKRLDPSQSGNNHEIAPEGAVRLLIRVDGDTEVVHVLGRKTTVGRTPDNDMQIDAKFISRNHAVILAGPNHTIIEDLNSTNGVAVNGKRITRHTLRDGDQVAIGKTTFRFAVRPTQDRR